MGGVLVIGWDGAEPSIISSLLAENKLPNLKMLIADGYFGSVRSTIRPESSVAWTSFATGTNPGVHGIYGFAGHTPNSYKTRLNTSASPHIPFFWELVGQAGKKVAILNIPMAYPPRPVNGWLVCGQMTPSADVVFTYPEQLSNRLRDQHYVIDSEAISPSEDRYNYAERMHAQVRQRTEVAVNLLRESHWDLAVIVHTELDRLQHFYWADMDAAHPLHPVNGVPQAIRDHYIELDRSLGQLLKLAESGTLTIVMSDHGFGPCSRKFYVNAWLCQQDYLVLNSQSARAGGLVLDLLQRARNTRSLHRLKRLMFGDRPVIAPLGKLSLNQGINWDKTRAWYSEVGGVRINLRGREPNGVVDLAAEYETLCSQLIDAAVSLRDPLTGMPVIAAAYRRTDLYKGPEVQSAPDIILDTYHPLNNCLQNHVLSSDLPHDHRIAFGSSWPYTGTHTGEALCASNSMPAVSLTDLTDITRWIVSTLGVDPASDADLTLDLSHEPHLIEADEETLRKRLSALGYL